MRLDEGDVDSKTSPSENGGGSGARMMNSGGTVPRNPTKLRQPSSSSSSCPAPAASTAAAAVMTAAGNNNRPKVHQRECPMSSYTGCMKIPKKTLAPSNGIATKTRETGKSVAARPSPAKASVVTDNSSTNNNNDASRPPPILRRPNESKSQSTPTPTPTSTSVSPFGDASVILTEDTDKFMVGQRVYVGGTKPGRIMFIGDVKFAPGEFAGVVLDEPVGKNDGSVGGYTYFQCAKNHGVFSRLTRLTFEPLSPTQLAERAAQSAAVVANAASDVGLGSPLRQASPSPSDRSLSQLGDLKIGDRVMVSSTTGGTKVGTLRFLGATEFQPGDWAGIELDDPSGKNDGSVAGTRYFECRPKHGLFAPVGKVARSPYQRRPSNTAGSRSGARRGSQDSLSSLSTTSSAKGYGVGSAAGLGAQRRSITGSRTGVLPNAAAAFQEAIKEKEVHIEQLLKEKDLERADLARAVARAEEINQNYLQTVSRFEQSEALIAQAQKQIEALRRDLEDEKRKNEDLEFRLEEQSLMMEEYKSQMEGGSKESSPKHGDKSKMAADAAEREELLKRKDLEIYELQEANMNREAEVANLAAKIEELESRLQSAPSVGDASDGVPESRLLEIEEEVELLRKACRDKDALVDTLNAQVVDLQASVGSYQQQLMLQPDEPRIDEADYKAVLNENEALKGENTTKSRRIDELVARIQELELNAGDESDEAGLVDALRGENEVLRASIKEKEGMLDALKAQVQVLEENFSKYQQELRERVVEGDQDRAAMEHLRSDLEAAQNRLNQVEQKLRESEDERIELANELAQSQNSFSGLEDSRNREEAKRKLLESNLEVLKDELAKSRSSYLDAQRDLENLRTERQRRVGVGEVDPRLAEAVRAKEDAVKQVDFLNSVIVEMQAKNQVLQTKLDAIMSDPGSLVDALLPDAGKKNNRPRSRKNRRLFCENCDQFDSHETDRCPSRPLGDDESMAVLAAERRRSRPGRDDDDGDVVVAHSKHHRPRNWTRPFCQSCECFGHDVTECPEQETF